MPLFAAIGRDHPPHAMDKRNTFRSEHRAYVRRNDACIRLVGPFLDADNNQCGSFYIFEADSEAEVQEWLDNEPFVKGGVYDDLLIRRFEVGMSMLPLQDWPIGGTTKASGK